MKYQAALKIPLRWRCYSYIGRKIKGRQNNVYLNLYKGQFLANAAETEDIKVRFDAYKAVTYFMLPRIWRKQ